MTEQIKVLFGLWTRVCPRKHATLGCTLASAGEYNWTVHVWWRYGVSVKLLWPLVHESYSSPPVLFLCWY